MNTANQLTDEWRRSEPDIVVYLPKGVEQPDTDNEHFLVFPAPESGDLLALWTQSSCEGRGDNHLALARSADGESWSEPRGLVGATVDGQTLQASWGFPVISKQGRIYVFYTRETPTVDNNRCGSESPCDCWIQTACQSARRAQPRLAPTQASQSTGDSAYSGIRTALFAGEIPERRAAGR